MLSSGFKNTLKYRFQDVFSDCNNWTINFVNEFDWLWISDEENLPIVSTSDSGQQFNCLIVCWILDKQCYLIAVSFSELNESPFPVTLFFVD